VLVMARMLFVGCIGLIGIVTSTGCRPAELLDLPSVASPTVQSEILTGRYLGGAYPGTINTTLDDPYPVYHFTYQNGVTLWALQLLHEQTGDADLLAAVDVAVAWHDGDNNYRPQGGDEPIDYLGSMAHATLRYGIEYDDARARAIGLEAAAYFLNDAARTPEGLLAYHENPARGRIWVDALYMTMPLLARAGQATGDSAYYDEVITQILGFAEKLYDEEAQLWHQGWNWHGDGASPGFWGRANGWAMAALTEALDVIPEGHPRRDELLALYQDFAAGLLANQGPTGMWHQLLDKHNTYAETSGTGLILYGLARGVQRGWLPAVQAEPVRQGYQALSQYITITGDITNVSPGTSTQSSESAYANRGPATNDSHGIGPAMLGVYAGMITPSE
jgi:rhamnogalacturonyl hydrolase YesR